MEEFTCLGEYSTTSIEIFLENCNTLSVNLRGSFEKWMDRENEEKYLKIEF